MNQKIIDIVTDRIIKSLEDGKLPPWRKTWTSGLPKNYTSNKEYRGINTYILMNSEYNSPYWLTYKQATEQGGNVKQGEHGTPVIFWKMLDGTETDKDKKIPLLRYYSVFNWEQTEGVPEKVSGANNDVVGSCENIISGYQDKPTIIHSDHAYYRKSNDTVGVPAINEFTGSAEYYSTLFHELTHSTGAEKRLNRKEMAEFERFGDTSYSFEELVAEMGSAFLCGTAGISNEVVDNQSAYIKGWLSVLKNDRELLVKAGTQSKKAVAYIMGESKEVSE